MLPFALEEDRACVPSSHQLIHLHSGGPHSRENECHRQPSLPPKPDPSHGVVTQPRDHETAVPPLGLSPCGPIHNKMEYKASNLRVSGSRSRSVSSGCTVSVLAEPVGLRLSVASTPHQGSDQAVPIQCLTAFCGSSLAGPALVSRPSESVSQPSQAAASDGDPSKTTSVGQVPSGPRQTPATCLEAVRRSLREVRFSRDTAESIAAPQASSTKSIYDGKILSLPLFP